ncbi:hypothetical protein [Polaribacter sp. ALD11]|uniref:hypothetical protein n=1 Tax=Polaribacter sp. ALD11 TaxID=2058137 RepID=UPI0012FD6DD0|nr:hypothetical protein [Polaribacter sp. ALD11]
MFLQILPPDAFATSENVLDNQLLMVILGLGVSVFVIIKGAKFLSKIKVSRLVKN